MDLIADHARLGLFLVLSMIAAALTGCGGGSSSSAGPPSSLSASTGGSSSSTGTLSSLVALSSTQYAAAPSSNAVLTIYRTGSPVGLATVGYATVDGSATAGVDYVATSGSVTWGDGDSFPRTVIVPVLSHAGDKSFAVALTDVEGEADFGTPAAATVEVIAIASVPGGSDTLASSFASGDDPTINSVTLSWLAPNENTNGTALTNLAGYNIYYGTNAASLTQKISVYTVGMPTYVISNLYAGTWYFAVTSINAWGVESSRSAVVSATI